MREELNNEGIFVIKGGGTCIAGVFDLVRRTLRIIWSLSQNRSAWTTYTVVYCANFTVK